MDETVVSRAGIDGVKLVLLTGPPGVGKTTTSALLPSLDPDCVVVEADHFRMMLRGSSRPPWDGAEGHDHEILVVEAAVHVALFFVARGFRRIVLVDTVSQEATDLYRSAMGLPVTVVKLSCADAARTERLGSRAVHMPADQLVRLTAHAETLEDEDVLMDSSEREPADVARLVLSLLG